MLTYIITFRIKPNWCKEIALTTSETLGQKQKVNKQKQNKQTNKIQSYNYECTWWSLFQKRVVRTKFYIYGFITITGSIPLQVDYQSPRVSSAQQAVFQHWHGLLNIFVIEIYSS